MTKQPNILFIMTDDHAAQAIGAYGSRINKTPNMDRIANEGARLDHCYVTNSICTPSRAAILTGTHNHVNCVTTLQTHIDNRLPNVAKHLKAGGYQTAMVGKWHLGTGPDHCPTGFDFWSVVPGQGLYFDPVFHEMGREIVEKGYATEVITEKSLNWLRKRDRDKPFFLMCHHKAPHRGWEYSEKYAHLAENEEIPYPDSFDDDYSNRAKAAFEARMRIESHMNYPDLDLVEPVGEGYEYSMTGNRGPKIIPVPDDLSNFSLTCSRTGKVFTFKTYEELKKFKYQRYIKKYIRTVASVDESVGQLLDYLDEEGLAEDTLVIYTSDQGFFLGEHGWFDKRFIYEESFKMPFLVRYPRAIPAGSVVKEIAQNVDFAPTFLDYAGLTVPGYMQGFSMKGILEGNTPEDWQDIAYHRYWMHRDPSHNAYAHYGIRDHKHKLVFWYNEGFGLPGTGEGGQEKEWELFDCEADPLELFNCIDDPAKKEVLRELLSKLDIKMASIGDIPEHDSNQVRAKYGL
jgi:arylsulfatase A-like enzyme